MAHLFNAACSALVTVNALNDDETTHRLTATTPSLAAFPFRFDFIITNVFRAVRLVVPAWGSKCVVRTASKVAPVRDDVIAVGVSATILDTVYRTRVTPLGSAAFQPEHVYVSVFSRSFPLRSDQIAVLQMGDRHLPILAIQTAFGTGKKLIAALIAIRTYLATADQQLVIATTTTNTAAGQFMDTALSIDAANAVKSLDASDSALVEGARQTPVYLYVIPERLPDDYRDRLLQRTPHALSTNEAGSFWSASFSIAT
ncbi:unnamed protein product [Haemonchus placei]|uniref:ResIII domain-containing protein n=1 Tax=Haemonchus placei TaxID=6290 RepID=A0A0N4W9W5_HAEPC|nr:unnamed protein product [Haemonchus placei]